MARIIMVDDVEAPLSVEELRQAAVSLLDDDFETYQPLSTPAIASHYKLGSGFAHIGTITEHGRRSYAKLTAVFGGASYPGSNCGISILGA